MPTDGDSDRDTAPQAGDGTDGDSRRRPAGPPPPRRCPHCGWLLEAIERPAEAAPRRCPRCRLALGDEDIA